MNSNDSVTNAFGVSKKIVAKNQQTFGNVTGLKMLEQGFRKQEKNENEVVNSTDEQTTDCQNPPADSDNRNRKRYLPITNAPDQEPHVSSSQGGVSDHSRTPSPAKLTSRRPSVSGVSSTGLKLRILLLSED
ncbi:hypothetical protein GCK72_019435 [Caenorhabditis remanei]|uniref:Uncharacterized protein n=1 Tax=Caenorhabditis remanei TaxID=31234 RepID=A0A6A5GCV1_CAERE|nr:hypothetical protein GCK72_019435 [Caenorhabditis remanei]KAF1752880.1 hypothetical protein GCK72_019435 [Caenorhabditis remanei]